VEQYDRKSLHPMLIKSYNHIHSIGDVDELVLQIRMLIKVVH